MRDGVVPFWAVIASIGLHLLLFGGLISMPMNGRHQVRHSLRAISFHLVPAYVPPPPAPKPAAKPAPKGVPAPRAPVKKKPAAVAKPRPVHQHSGKAIPPPHPVPEKAVETPTAPSVAGTTLTGLDSQSFPYDYYIQQFLSRISANWFRPALPGKRSCVIAFVIKRTGRINNIRVEKSSGVPAFDRAALRAVYGANPLPPLPYAFSEDSLGIHLTFE